MDMEREEALRELLVINAGLGICTPEEGYNSLKWALDDLHRGLDALAAEGIRLRGEQEQERVRCAAIVASQMESIYDRCGTAVEHILKPDAEYDTQCLQEWVENEWAERIACRV